MKLFAQQGYGKGDKIHNGLDRKVLDGVILSPRDEKCSNMKIFRKELNEQYSSAEVLFDPQFYYATFIDATSKNLNECDYYPGNIPLSSLRQTKNLNKYAMDCLKYQQSLGVSKLISPTIHIPNFTDRQAQIALTMAEESINVAQEIDSPLIISLVFNENALNETANVNEFLNELSMLEAEGFYITVARSNTDYNQTFDESTSLTNLLTMIYSLADINEFKVIMGYSDIIGLLYLAVGAYGIGTGWYNSSRKFTIQQRILPSKGGRVPRERYTSVPLLNSMFVSELDSIKRQVMINGGDIKDYLSNTDFDEVILAGTNPSEGWSRGISHVQHWAAIKKATTNIFGSSSVDISDRLDNMEQRINEASSLYKILKSQAVQFDKPNPDNHLAIWKNAIDQFRTVHNV
jgi:hypothetical protein